MSRLAALAALALSTALTCTSAVAAKDFAPGDLRACSAKRCVAITDRAVLRAFSTFYYAGPQPRLVPPPRAGAPALELRFKDGYATGVVGGAGLDRSRVYGLNCGRFRRGAWYRLPEGAVLELRALATRLGPLPRVPTSVPRSC
jgi:hypothetical protein